METSSPLPESDAVVRRVGEVALRMMANAISPRTMQRVRGLMAEGGDEYPWQRVVDEVLADPVPPDDLLSRGLRAQRDWIARPEVSATARVTRAARVAGKTALAYVLSRLIFGMLYAVTVVCLLILAKHQWPWFDIYRVLDWLREAVPALFRR